MTNTIIEYMYRDASNYKQYHSVVIEGELTWAEIEPYLDKGEYFIPGQVGLPELQWRFPSFPSEDDHVWHELHEEGITFTDVQPVFRMSAHQLLENFKRAGQTGWLIKEAEERLGIE